METLWQQLAGFHGCMPVLQERRNQTASALTSFAKPRRRRCRIAVAVGATALGVMLVAMAVVMGVRHGPVLSVVGVGHAYVPSAEDGYLPDGERLSPFDDSAPLISRLDPDLRDAVRRAATDAATDGVEFGVTSGWRSPALQQYLLDQAVDKYGSLRQARRFVSTPKLSHHVSGDAVDVGPLDAALWLMEHGVRYGLCQTYANERWHFELATTPGRQCPPQLPDAS